jgi:3,4-dihydroxy-9,10-secoandrosta-1,3,5(10)-triene-9,17-dione 4,5-dioxygenase
MEAFVEINGLGYVVVNAKDPAAWVTYGEDILGMMCSPGLRDGELHLRMDDRPFRLSVLPGAADGLAAVGWEVPNRSAFERAAEELSLVGVAVKPGDDRLKAERRVTDLVTFQDPDGVLLELFYGPHLDHLPFVSPRGVTGFVTGDMGMGHVVLSTTDLAKSLRFYTDVMGFRVSDTMTLGETRIAFLHCNPRHHSLALGEGPGSSLAHFMVEVASIDDVGYALDRVTANGIRLRQTLGRHTNDHMLSFYAATPSGFSVEYGWGGRRVDDSTWTVSETTRGSLWGHQRPPRPPVA